MSVCLDGLDTSPLTEDMEDVSRRTALRRETAADSSDSEGTAATVNRTDATEPKSCKVWVRLYVQASKNRANQTL